MASEKILTSSELIYQQAADKQRIVVTGNQASVIISMIVHALTANDRLFDLIRNGEVIGNQSVKDSPAPVVLIEESKKPYTGISVWQHHIAVISPIDGQADVLDNVTRFADGTPKAGIILYCLKGASEAIGKKPRTDVTAIAYDTFAHKVENGRVYLVTSTDERFPVLISGELTLQSLSAAKEVLKKIGITSGQFYKAMVTFKG